MNKFSLNACAKILEESFSNQFSADLQLRFFFKKNKNIGKSERSLIADTYYNVIRNKRYLEVLGSTNNPFKLILIYLIKIQGRSIRDLLPLINKDDGLWLSKIKANKLDNLSLSEKLSLPEWLWLKLARQYKESLAMQIANSLLLPAQLCLRVNTLKRKGKEEVIAELKGSFCEVKDQIYETKISPIGVILPRGSYIQKHPLFLEGNIEVQDEGSQLLSYLVNPKRGQMVADFCAGAGGKTLAMASIMKNTGRIYSFDVSGKRLDNLKIRLKRSGASNISMQKISSENDNKIKRLKEKFDRVLVDAPCTGFGTLRRNPDLKWKHSEKSLLELIAKQKKILQSAARLCKKKGLLIYATCSLLDEENEQQVENFLSENSDFKLLGKSVILEKYGLVLSDGKYLKLNPFENDTDGFFGAVMERVK
ncbi:MAG: RsmB/NOP family class I SAM-dependent RNA methyltransferase [Nitrosomonadales bacterium]|nr:RsmB/NOP family class I SAM-dependent RNA methyltransferase [Nitrosomonadales bacterium]MBT7407013.1 RsmB/NOP family class I SAM-dependent RNA methyltransferase [Nitrosomonadales bacterium]